MNYQIVNEISRRIDTVSAEMHVIQNMLTTIQKNETVPANNKLSIDNHLAVKLVSLSHPFSIKNMMSKMKCLTMKLRIVNNGFTDGYKLSMDYIVLQSKDGHYCSFPKEKGNPETIIKFLGSEMLILSFHVPKEISEFDLLIRDLHGLRAAEHFCLPTYKSIFGHRK